MALNLPETVTWCLGGKTGYTRYMAHFPFYTVRKVNFWDSLMCDVASAINFQIILKDIFYGITQIKKVIDAKVCKKLRWFNCEEKCKKKKNLIYVYDCMPIYKQLL